MARIRDIALSSYNLSRGREAHLDKSKPSMSRRLAESVEKLSQSRNKRPIDSSAAEPRHSSTKRMQDSSLGDDHDVIILEDLPEGSAPTAIRNRGTMTDRVRISTGENEKAITPKKVLRLFRVNEKKLA
jgi:hypothetical protein